MTDKLLQSIEGYAQSRHIPIIRRETANLLKILLISKKPMELLEIGTAVGYSAICMMSVLPAGARIDTIENEYEVAARARENIREAGYGEQIRLIYGDASEIMKNLDKRYDLIFIDAAKGQYNDYLKLAKRLLVPDALLIADNVLYKGMVSNTGCDRKKTRTIIQSLRKFTDTLKNDSSFITVILDIGDGVSVSSFIGGRNEI